MDVPLQLVLPLLAGLKLQLLLLPFVWAAAIVAVRFRCWREFSTCIAVGD